MKLFTALVPVVAALYPLAALSQTVPDKHPVVFWQAGFPTVASQPVPQGVLQAAVPHAVFAGLDQLTSGGLDAASLLVLPYGSAVPVAAWPAIQRFVDHGGNLLVVGGQALRVPVTGSAAGSFVAGPEQDSYSRQIGIVHSYVIPPEQTHESRAAWRDGYSFLPPITVHASAFYAEEGRLNGLAYMQDAQGTRDAAAVIVADRAGSGDAPGARIVALPFNPVAGFWSSADGKGLLTAVAAYAQGGVVQLRVELQHNALRPGERPEITLHLRAGYAPTTPGSATVEILRGTEVVRSGTVALGGRESSAAFAVPDTFAAGVYTVRALWSATAVGNAPAQREFAENGFVVEQADALDTGPALGTQADFLTLGGKPFLPVGTNYFSTDAEGWDFSGPRNGATWERDFASLQQHGVNFVRTGVWMSHSRFVEPLTGEVNLRFQRNLEAFLSAAQRHGIVVNFTFFAFTPQGLYDGRQGTRGAASGTVPNPYLDRTVVAQEKQYVRSIAERFRHVPWLSWDLINEPSFSNPDNIFHGNTPNGDPAELAAWRAWLRTRYGSVQALAEAWRVTAEQLGSFDSVPLPERADLAYGRYGNAREVRALDYNLFAQDMFSAWVRGMVETIHGTGSTQLINVGQDEGGVTNRLLNQFYATAGVSFTTNHTYWSDDALLWDSVVAKRPGMPNITGETGYQPAWNPDGTWRYDELTGTALEERKWALGFAAGSSGAVQWDWDREVDFGMERSDGSAKVWQAMMRDLGAFARAAAPQVTGLTLPEVALILPQSLQLSVLNPEALAAQQTAVRVLYGRNRVEAYAVGEYQTDTLGSPRLIIVPSAYGLTAKSWTDILARVRAGSVLLLSGPFTGDEHLHETGRAQALGLSTELSELLLRDGTVDVPGLPQALVYEGLRTTKLDRLTLPGGKTWAEVPLGAGKVLVSAFPLELNARDEAVEAAYAYALRLAGVGHVYTTHVTEPGILICPTRLAHSTLYVLSSEAPTQDVDFVDLRSGAAFRGTLQGGHAALLLVGEHGELLANYRWQPRP